MKKYTAPVFEVTALIQQDILNGSDVLIDGSELFGTENWFLTTASKIKIIKFKGDLSWKSI